MKKTLLLVAMLLSAPLVAGCGASAEPNGRTDVEATPAEHASPETLRKVWACTLVNGEWYCRWIYINSAVPVEGDATDVAPFVGTSSQTTLDIQKPGH